MCPLISPDLQCKLLHLTLEVNKRRINGQAEREQSLMTKIQRSVCKTGPWQVKTHTEHSPRLITQSSSGKCAKPTCTVCTVADMQELRMDLNTHLFVFVNFSRVY